MELTTESANPASADLDKLDTLALVELINDEDSRIADAVRRAEASVAAAIDLVAERLAAGGRRIYVGAGTSGRLGVLDASECPPTFNADPSMVIGLIAGGAPALQRAVEGAEDSPDAARTDLDAVNLTERDVVFGIAASGGTPYVIGALETARARGAATIGFTCNRDAPIGKVSDVTITVVVGPEVLAGSTRMKAGTATKMVLNTVTTGAMIRLGKTYGNLMVDLQATNKKLVKRATGLVCKLTGLGEDDARALLDRCDGDVKTSVVSQRLGVKPKKARKILESAGGRLRVALNEDV